MNRTNGGMFIIIAIIIALLVSMGIPLDSCNFWEPAPTPSEGLEFGLNEGGESYHVKGIGECTDKDIVIPSIYENMPVTRIGNEAFNDCADLTSVTIPDSVKSIGVSAFDDCSSLTSVDIPDSVTFIGSAAFRKCYNLTSVDIPDSVTFIGDGAFLECDSLESVTLPEGITSINDYTFHQCLHLENITIPAGVTVIGTGAFARTGLTNIAIPDGVTSIERGAFSTCISLTSVTIPDSVKSIECAFCYCELLTSASFEDIEGWKTVDADAPSDEGVELSGEYLDDPTEAADILTDTEIVRMYQD